ncbi:MAG: patatin, partial [Harvfovirus sp.]
MNGKVFKILCVDGGGIKGLYSLYVLREFEKQFCKEGECLGDYFDMICGTSTGGI